MRFAGPLAWILGAARLGRDRRAQISISFALSAVAVFTAIGSGFDLSRAYIARQQLSSAAALACQYANRPSVAEQAFGANSATFATAVGNQLTRMLAAQNLSVSQTNANPFTYTAGGAGDINLSASMPTTLMKLMGITSVPVSASAHCFDKIASAPQPPADASQSTVFQEGFENKFCSGCTNWYWWNGTHTAWFQHGSVSPTGTPPSNAGYVGLGGVAWTITGYCLEVDPAGSVAPTAPEGSYFAELDCDNGNGSGGNSAISTRVYLQAGQSYELRYFYKSREYNDNYSPTYICGSQQSDTSWANDSHYYQGYDHGTYYTYANSPAYYGARTNQINVYLDAETASGSFPTHVTLDGALTLGGSNMIDTCVHASDWIERSVSITPTTAGYYWLSFAADGTSDSYGGLIDNVRLCIGTCAGSAQDNFPAAWQAVNNGGNYKTLFEDTFDSPTYTPAANSQSNTSGNLNNSLGTSGTSASGWPGQASGGWATAPSNDVAYVMTGAAQGNQAIEPDAVGTSNPYTSRQFLLVPGYYKVMYNYVANGTFSALDPSVWCGATPSGAQIPTLSGATGTVKWRLSGNTIASNVKEDTNTIGLFVSHVQLVSTPIGGGALRSTTSFVNPDGSTSTTPTAAANAISLTSYNSAQNNALIDICGYASTWQTRTAYIRIVKPANYLLTAAALGSTDQIGGSIDDVRVIAMGGPYMSGPPASFVTIPVPNPQPLTTLSFTGFTFLAESQYQ